MATGDDGATVADHPDAAPPPTLSEPTVQLSPSRLASASLPADVAPRTSSHSLTTAVEALRDEEVARTRLFIRMGWALSVASIAIVPLLGGPLPIRILFVGGLVVGMIVSFFFHRAFADPRRYTDRALWSLAMVCVVNAHIAVLYFGTFSAAPGIILIGIHFAARTEQERLARAIFATAIVCYSIIALPIATGQVADPGVFASDRLHDLPTRLLGLAFVLGMFLLAYVTARAFRAASLRSIEHLQKATRLASQRQALLDELRVDLERALRVGAPGRHTEQIVGQHQLGVLLGRGAMGEVYEAVHLGTGEPAAVKLLRRELTTDPTHVARFLREVRTSGALDSPHIVKVLDTSTAEAALPYLVMERLRGTTLAELIRVEPRLSSALVIELVRQVGAGIDVATAAGIVHRDLKPQNLMRTAGDLWKILDFGVATLAEENTGTLTQGGVVGTPNYMAPEQAQGKRVDGRADLYALAVVAFRCLTGRHAFDGPDTPSLLYAVVHHMPARPGSLADVPADVDRWFAIALAKLPEDRFATGAELADAFAAAFGGTLSPALARRADALVRKQRWSTP